MIKVNTKVNVLLIWLFLIAIACKHSHKKKAMVASQDSVNTINVYKEQEQSEKTNRFEEQEKAHNIRLKEILAEAIKLAEQNRDKDRFKESHEETMPDSSYNIEVDISSDFFFTNISPHLIIKRKTPGSIYIDVFLNTGKEFKKLISHEQAAIEYTGDTIRDINGDGLKDFVVNWYGSAGCCLKGFSHVYILKADQGFLSTSFEFINPTFYPKEKIIRGVCYGHIGETEMYKYKWNGETVDTLEYVSFEKNNRGEKTGKILIAKGKSYDDDFKVLKRLNDVPNEYKGIDGFDWFMGNYGN